MLSLHRGSRAVGLDDRLQSRKRPNPGVNSLTGFPEYHLETRPSCCSQQRVLCILVFTNKIIAPRCQALCYWYIAIAHDNVPLFSYSGWKHVTFGSLTKLALIYGHGPWSLAMGSNAPCSGIHLELQSSEHHPQDGKRSPLAALTQIANPNVHCLQGLGVRFIANTYLILCNRWLSNKVPSIIIYHLYAQSSQGLDTLTLSYTPLATSPCSECQRSPPHSPFGEQWRYIGQSLPGARD